MDPKSQTYLNSLRSFVSNVVKQTEQCDGCECSWPPSLMLVGPPGAGKTFLVKQMTSVCCMPLLGVHTHALSNSTEVRDLFNRARGLDCPSMLFLDDLDAIFTDQDNPTNSEFTESFREELYSQMGPRKLKIFDSESSCNPVQNSLPKEEGDDVERDEFIVVAATSAPWKLYKDHELLSRFRGVFLVGLPDRETRFCILKMLLRQIQHNLTEKDMWVVADETEGYTPSDLLMLAKSLQRVASLKCEQLSRLLAMVGRHEGSEGETSEEDTDSVTSSDITETDSNSEGVDTPFQRVSPATSNVALATAALAKALTSTLEKEETSKTKDKDNNDKTNDEAKTSKDEDSSDTTLTAIARDWLEDNNDKTPSEESTKSGSERPDNEITTESYENKSNEDVDSLSSTQAQKSSKSDSEEDSDESGVVLNGTGNGTSLDSNEPTTPSDDDEPKEFTLHVVAPAAPYRNDNNAVDSDSDNESSGSGGKFLPRNRRVNFVTSALRPLSVEVDRHSDGDYVPNVSLSSAMDDSMLPKASYASVVTSSSNNILKQLLASSMNNDSTDEGSDVNLNSKREKNNSKEESTFLNEVYTVYNNNDNSNSSNDVDEPDAVICRPHSKMESADLLQSFPLLGCNNLSEEGLLTPAGSDSSGRLAATDNSSDSSGSGRRIRMKSPNKNGEMDKTRSSDSSLYEKSGTPTIPSSDISTNDSNTTGETLECHSDSDERLRNLEDDLKDHRLTPTRSCSTTTSEDDEDELTPDESSAQRRIFSLNNFAEISLNNMADVTINILTLSDVLKVLAQTPRSVPDDLMKRYSDFMNWFSNVAKLACPHNKKGLSSPSSDSNGESSVWNDSQSGKKRKGPLRKFGRFLLKAFIFLLD